MQFCNSLCWSGFAIVCIARDQSRRSRRHQESNIIALKAPLRSEIVPQLDVLPRSTIILDVLDILGAVYSGLRASKWSL